MPGLRLLSEFGHDIFLIIGFNETSSNVSGVLGLHRVNPTQLAEIYT